MREEKVTLLFAANLFVPEKITEVSLCPTRGHTQPHRHSRGICMRPRRYDCCNCTVQLNGWNFSPNALALSLFSAVSIFLGFLHFLGSRPNILPMISAAKFLIHCQSSPFFQTALRLTSGILPHPCPPHPSAHPYLLHPLLDQKHRQHLR